MRLLTYVVLACSLAVSVYSTVLAAPKHSTVLEDSASHTTVLPLSEAKWLMRGDSGGYWTPGKADLRGLESKLPKYLAAYYRQYLGISESGTRLILINGFSNDVAPEFTGGKDDWHRHAVFVDDGGNNFFQATYNPKTHQFVGPQFNGMG